MKRKFVPGSEWLYIKIYTGVKTADLVLEEIMRPLLEDFQKTGCISKWFFIRYNDPKPHLRIRLHLNNNSWYNEILTKLNQAFEQYIDSGEIATIQFDTYNREIERYGKNTIELAESLFYKNSEFTIECLHYDDEEKIITAMFCIHEILAKLELSIHDKIVWMKDLNDSFKAEFNADKKLNSSLDKKYREFKPKYIEFLHSDDFSQIRSYIVSHIETNTPEVQKITFHHKNKSLGVSLQNFFQSIFHMHINRLFVSRQRVFEMIIYDYLMRYYKSNLIFKNKV